MSARLRRSFYVVLEAGKTGDLPSLLFDTFMVMLILANLIVYTLETVPAMVAEYGPYMLLFEIVSIAIFTVEYAVRLWVCVEHPPLHHLSAWRVRFRWAVTPAMIIDFLAIAPFFLGMLFSVDLRILRVFRLLRFLKLARYSPALSTLGRVMVSEGRAILGALIIMMGLLVCASAVIYALERHVQPEAFGTIPDAMWWALATLTTVGYGDVVPITPVGRIFGGLVMLFGLGMFALPIAILSNGFAREIHKREFVVSWGMLARVPLFQDLPPAALADLLDLLHSQVFPAQSVIAHRGEEADGMYFVVLGRVQLDLPNGPIEVGPDTFFGEMALLDKRRRSVTITAVTRCHLLKMSVEEFHSFIARHPQARERIMETARRRMRDRGITDEIEQEIETEIEEGEARS